MKSKIEHIDITLPRELILKAKEHCYQTGKTFSGLVRVAITREIEERK